MSKGRMLVTGGAGFIGSHVIEAAAADGWEVAALDDLSTGKRTNLPAGIALYEVDVRNADAVSRAVREFRPTVISHQAAQASVSVSVREPLLDAEVNIMGGLNVLMAARTHEVQRIVFASTGGAIYGEVPSRAANEQTPARPYSPYATSKLSFEHYLETFRQQYGLESSILRYANVYGPLQNPHVEAGVVAIFTDRLLAGQAVTVNAMRATGDEGCLRDYVFVADVARANIAAANGLTPPLLNVGTGIGTTTQELVRQLAATLGMNADVQFAPPRSGDLERSVLDPNRFITALGRPLSLEEGLQQTAGWARDQHEGQ